jgi:hypothetical protein
VHRSPDSQTRFKLLIEIPNGQASHWIAPRSLTAIYASLAKFASVAPALALEGGSLTAAIATMTVYALGAAGALLVAGYAVGRAAAKARFAWAGAGGRIALGAAFALIGAAVLTGLDHRVEAVLIAAMPDWLTAFATSL